MAAIDSSRIDLAADIVRRELSSVLNRSSTGRPGQPLANEILDLVVSQSLVPVLVAVTSTRLSDILNERRLKRMNRDTAVEVANQLIGAEVKSSIPNDTPAVDELRKLLAPYGFSDSDISNLLEVVRKEID